jgi:aminoglycoside 3-N-acetyltransferase
LSKKNNLKRKIKLLFKDLKIRKNDNIIIHSNSAGIFQFKNLKKNDEYINFFKLIKKIIGKKGTILIPTYNYDFAKGKVFDQRKTHSQVGSFSNYLLNKYYKNRSNEPIFSHLIFGKLKKKLMKCDLSDAFGNKSIFAMMEKFKFKIICFCCSPRNITFLHYIERAAEVKYRYNKVFKGFVLKNKKKIKFKLKYFVRKKINKHVINEKNVLKLLNQNEFVMKKFGKFLCYSVNCDYLLKRLKKKLFYDNFFLVK